MPTLRTPFFAEDNDDTDMDHLHHPFKDKEVVPSHGLQSLTILDSPSKDSSSSSSSEVDDATSASLASIRKEFLEKEKTRTFKQYPHSVWGNIQSLDFSIDGKYVATTEESNMLRVFDTSSYLESKSDTQITNEHVVEPLAVACHKTFFVCSSGSSVCTFSLPEGRFQKLITRHSLPVRALAVSPDGKDIATGSDDHTIRWINIATPESMMELTHHTAPITSLSVDPLNRYLLSTSLEGKLCIWDIHLKKLEASFNITKNVKVIRSTDVSIARWSNTGKYIATNATGNEIIILRRNQKNVHAKLLEHSKPVTNLDWSNRDPYLASVSADKVLMIWNVETKSILFQYTFAFTPLHVRWQPYFPHLVVTFNRQSLAVVQLPYFHDPPKDALHQLMDEPLPQPIQSEKDDSELDDRMDESASDLDDFIVDDEGEGPSRKEKKEILNAQLRQAGFVETTPMQPSFQPGATPVSSEKYYLAFNMHGLIYAVQQDIATSYHIERHDRSRHKPIQFTDVRDFTFASLSHVAAVFACPPEKDLLGSLYVRILDPYSTQSDWTVMLAADEPPLGVAAGDNVVLVTDTLVRIYSVGGMPLHMISMSGIYVSVVAQAQLCVILTHSAAPFQDRQQLSFSVMDLHSAHSLHEGRVPLPPHAVVSWLGLSDTGLPLILDSLGTLRGYSWELEHWCPLLSTKKLETDASLHYFGVGLVDTQFLCLVSKTKYPGFPRPALSEYPCEFLVQQPLEKQYLRLRFFKPNAIKSYEKCILQLIQMACQNELHQKALDLVGLLTTPMSFSKATQIALFYHLHTLAEKIQKIGEQKQAEPILEHEPPSVPPPSIHSSVPPSNFTPQLPLNESTPLFPESHPSNAHVESSKRLPTFEPINSNKKPRLNPFLKKNFNPFRETPPTVSIHHSKVEVPLKQGSLSNFITHPNKDMQGE